MAEPAVNEGPIASESSERAWPHHAVLSMFTFLWGANFILAEVALREMSPIAFSVSRFVVGGLSLVALLYWQCIDHGRRRGHSVRLFPRLALQDWPRLIGISLIGAALGPWLGIEGLGLTHGARAALWLAMGPIFSTGFGRLLGTERIGLKGYFGVCIAALGTVVLGLDGLDPGRNFWLGDLLLVSALLMVVTELHLIKPLAARYGPTPMVTARTLIGGCAYLIIASGSLVQQPWLALGPWTWIAIIFGGAVGVGVGQWAKVRALQSLGPTRVVLYGNLVPLAAIAIAWIALGTMPSLLEAIAGILIITGAVLLQVFDVRFSR